MSAELQRWDQEGREGLVPPEIRTAVRGQTVSELTAVIEYLKPYATGMMGEAPPIMIELYRKYQRERALLAGAYSHAPVREPVVEAEVIEVEVVDPRARMERVLLELERLEAE